MAANISGRWHVRFMESIRSDVLWEQTEPCSSPVCDWAGLWTVKRWQARAEWPHGSTCTTVHGLKENATAFSGPWPFVVNVNSLRTLGLGGGLCWASERESTATSQWPNQRLARPSGACNWVQSSKILPSLSHIFKQMPPQGWPGANPAQATAGLSIPYAGNVSVERSGSPG